MIWEACALAAAVELQRAKACKEAGIKYEPLPRIEVPEKDDGDWPLYLMVAFCFGLLL